MPMEKNELKTGAGFGRAISSFVNNMDDDPQIEAAQIMARDHRTLQQNTMRFFMMFVAEMALQEHTDARNDASVRLAKKIMEIPERDRALPYI